MGLNVLYDPGVNKHKIKLSHEIGKGLTVYTEKPMPFREAVKMDYISYDGFLYEMAFEETDIITNCMKILQEIDFGAIMNSDDDFDRKYSEVSMSQSSFRLRFKFIIQNVEKSENTEVRRVHQSLLCLFDHIGMADWYDYDNRRKVK